MPRVKMLTSLINGSPSVPDRQATECSSAHTCGASSSLNHCHAASAQSARDARACADLMGRARSEPTGPRQDRHGHREARMPCSIRRCDDAAPPATGLLEKRRARPASGWPAGLGPPSALASVTVVTRLCCDSGWLVLQVPLLQATTALPVEPEFHGDDTPVFWRFGHDLTARLREHGFETELLCTDEFLNLVRAGATRWYGPASAEFDADALVTCAVAEDLAPVADPSLAGAGLQARLHVLHVGRAQARLTPSVNDGRRRRPRARPADRCGRAAVARPGQRSAARRTTRTRPGRGRSTCCPARARPSTRPAARGTSRPPWPARPRGRCR